MSSLRRTVLLAVLLTATDAAATVHLTATCSGDVVSVRVSVCNDYPSDLTGFVITRQPIGTCDGPETLTPSPTPLPAPGSPYVDTDWTGYDYSFTAPYTNVHYRYAVLFTDASGSARSHSNGWFPMWDCQPVASAVLSCAEAVVMRGTVVPFAWLGDMVTIMLLPCPEGCWGTDALVFDVAMSDPLVTQNPGGRVDIYGTLAQENCFPFTLVPYDATRLEPAPGGSCGPVPEETTSFGTLKAMYR